MYGKSFPRSNSAFIFFQLLVISGFYRSML